MGLLDRWVKKKTEEQLDRAEKKAVEVVKVEEKAPKTAQTEKKAVKKTKKTTTAAKTDKKEKTDEKKKDIKIGGIAHNILVRPLVTEKSAIMQSQNKYSFLVARGANKQQVKEAVRELYGVAPESVNVINVSGRYVRFGQNFGRRSDYKKAVVTLPAGKTITIHEGV